MLSKREKNWKLRSIGGESIAKLFWLPLPSPESLVILVWDCRLVIDIDSNSTMSPVMPAKLTTNWQRTLYSLLTLWTGFVFFLASDSFPRNEIETQLKFIKMWGVRRTSETVWLMRATAINYCSYCSAKPARSVICQETLSTCNVPLARSSDTLWFVFVFLQTHAMIRL